MRRVFVTGMGPLCAFGKSWEEIKKRFEAKENAVRKMDEWERFKDLQSRIAAPIDGYKPPKEWTRKQLRSMGRVSQYSVEATGIALKDAGLFGDESIKDGRMGVSSGFSIGSTDDIKDVGLLLANGVGNYNSNTYIRMMPHATPANIALFYGLKGRIIPTSSACTASSHGIGYAYEAIKYGLIEMMVAGGAEELCPSETFIFDTLYAASTINDTPKKGPRPFDKDRDGIVLGEGSGMLILESEESALKRGATIYAEVVGFGSTCDGTHVTKPQADTMKEAMILALKDAKLNPKDIGYINAHATATKLGDIAETKATNELFGEDIAISALKSYLGHTLGACGALESIFCINMMNDGCFYPTINLDNIDEQCAKLNYLTDITKIDTEYVMSNNFAFGGINTSLIFKKVK